MSGIFLKVLNMSIAAGWLILAVILLRLLLKKAPKWSVCLLWGLAALRLVVPFSLESIFSLIPSSETVPANIEMMGHPAIDSGIRVINEVVNPVVGSFAPEPNFPTSVNPLQIVVPLLGTLWLAGIAAMLIYALASYLKLKKSVAASVPVEDGVMACDEVQSPFILGVFRPMIYLPSGMEGETREYVLDHERAHLARRDHLWKPLGFLILAVHWFNPLCWIAYILLCRDIEAACDEKVIRSMDKDAVAAYSQALLDGSFPRKRIAACPLAFGEVGVKERVKNVQNYKKPAFWIIVSAVVICIIAGVCFLTNPKKDKEPTDSQTETHTVFTATVIRNAGDVIYVEPDAGTSERRSSDNIEVLIKDMAFDSAPAAGDRVEIDHDGMIQEVYPARLSKVWSVRVIAKGESVSFISPGIYQSTEGYTLQTEPSGGQIYPYVSFYDGTKWRAGVSVFMSYGIDGQYTQEGDRILLRQQRTMNGPIDDEATIELQILSKTELKVVRATDEANSVLIKEGDILAYLEQKPADYSTVPLEGRIYEGTNLMIGYATTADNCEEFSCYAHIRFEEENKWSGGYDAEAISYHVEGEYTREGDRIMLQRMKGGNSAVKDDFYMELQILSDTDIQVVRLGEAAFPSPFNEGDIFALRQHPGWTEAYLEMLQAEFPEYFGLPTDKGLEVYVWQMTGSNYSFGLMAGTNRDKTFEELASLKAATADEMKAILSTYGIPTNDIDIIPYRNPLSSYYYEIGESYVPRVRLMLFGNE